MPKISATQITQFADNLVTIARLLGDHIIAHQLSVKGRLGKLHADLLDQAAELYQLSAIAVGKEVRNAFEELNELTTEIQESDEKLNDIKLMISIATNMVTMSTALITRDFDAFIQAVKDLRSLRNPENED